MNVPKAKRVGIQLGQRHKHFGKAVARRNNRRILGGSHTLWPVVYTDILAATAILALASSLLIDDWASRTAKSASPDIIAFFGIITDWGKSEWILFPTGIVCLVLVFFNWQMLHPRKQVWLSNFLFDAWFLFLAVAGSGIVTNLIKVVFGRARPKYLDTLGADHFDPFRFEASFASFPSGHSTTIAALATVLSLRFPRFAVLFMFVAVLIGASRVFVGAHYPSDVLFGLVTGMLFTLFLARNFAVRKTGIRFIDDGSIMSTFPRRHIVRGL